MSPRHSKGFTLLELVVVIAVFGVFASMAYGGLNYVLKARKQIETQLDRTAEWQKAFQKMRNDFELASARAARDGFGETRGNFLFDEYGARIELTRAGWRNPLNQPRPSLERVVWRYEEKDKQLLRETWRVLDRARDTDPVQLVVLTGITEVKWRFLDVNREWQQRWPPQSGAVGTAASVPTPKAMEVTLTSKDFGVIRWLFRPSAEAATAAQLNGGGAPPAPTLSPPQQSTP
jgi:general secretion pathway protein J